MSGVAKGKILSKVTFEGKEYLSLSNPLSYEIHSKIHLYKRRKKLPLTFIPWLNYKYKWVVEDGKLFLNYIHIKDDDQDNCIKDIVNDDKIFASWVNEEIKLRIYKKDIIKPKKEFTDNEIEAITTKGRAFVEIKLIVLYFKDGKFTYKYENVKERYLEGRLRDLANKNL